MRPRLRWIWLGMALVVVAACGGGGDGGSGPSPPAVASVIVSPQSLSLSVGQNGTLTAQVLDANGSPLAGRTASWTTSDGTIATVSSGGVVTAVSPGMATVRATVDSKVGSATVTVTPAPVASVAVAPASLTLAVGLTAQFTATPLDAGGQPLSGRTPTWTSSDVTLVSVSTSGLITALALGGPVTITASIEGKAGSATVRVVNLATIVTASNDVYFAALVQHLSGAVKPTMDQAMALCRTGAAEGNIAKIEACLGQARAAATSATDPTDKALLGSGALFLDFIEREKAAASPAATGGTTP
jgi:uncharacterized protein YjdB